MKVELANGQEATLRERLTYGQAHGVRVAFFQMEANAAAKADLDLALVKAYVSAWNVLDPDGKAVSLDTPEQAPDDVIQALAQQAGDLFGSSGDILPKAGDGSSPNTPPEQLSSPTNGSETFSFSTLTPPGPGTT